MAKGSDPGGNERGEVMADLEKLTKLYKQANSLNEELPGDIVKKLSLYGKILEILGGFHAQSVKEWKLAEATRREALASAFCYDIDGSVVERTNKAEIAAAPTRKKEAEMEAQAQRWRNAYNSTSEIIQILKLQLKDMQNLDRGGV